VKPVGLLTPHKGDVSAIWRSMLWSGPEHVDTIPLFKVVDDVKFGLVSSVSSEGPVMCHIN
jgi:hypothetical protein